MEVLVKIERHIMCVWESVHSCVALQCRGTQVDEMPTCPVCPQPLVPSKSL